VGTEITKIQTTRNRTRQNYVATVGHMNSLGCEEDIGRLDITVNDAALVAVSQRPQQLIYYHCRTQCIQLDCTGFHHRSNVMRNVLERYEILSCNNNIVDLC